MENNENQVQNEFTPQEYNWQEEEKMIRRARLIDRLILAGIILLIIGAVCVAGYFITRDSDDVRYSEYDAQVDKLAYKKQQLLSEREKLGPDTEKSMCYMSFIFTSLDEALYTSAYSIMAEGATDIVGILAMSPTDLPGMEGKITKEQFDELIQVEWGTALYWNGEGDLEEFITTMQTLLGECDIDFPETIIFKNGKYSGEYDELILSYGIENAIHNGETGLAVRIEGQPEGVWHPGVLGWKAGPSATKLKNNVRDLGGYALFEINFNNSTDNSACSYFEIEGEGANVRLKSFKTMINLFKTMIDTDEMEVLTTDEARARLETYYSELTTGELEQAQRRKEIDEEIAEIERRMTELYYEYYGG